MVTKSKAPVAVQATDAAQVDATVTLSKATAAERLVEVLTAIGKSEAKPYEPADIKWGKAVGLAGGGSVYINRTNADVRSTQKQVADWAKTIPGSTVRGSSGQYLRIAF
jgi:hypothetical protein